MPVPILVNSLSKLYSLLNELGPLPTDPPSLFVDLEGISLSRHGSVSIVTIYAAPLNTPYLVDVHHLGQAAISTTNGQGISLKSILECPETPKVFFDVRNDSDALYSHFGVHLAGIKDIQLMELASRPGYDKDHVCGLSKCVDWHSTMSTKARAEFVAAKEKAVRLFAPEKGGSYEVFNKRPLPENLVDYCARDVITLVDLYDVYSKRLRQKPALRQRVWKHQIHKETLERIRQSQSPGYEPNGRSKARGPWKGRMIAEIESGKWDERLGNGW